MKFTFPTPPTQQQFFQGIGTLRNTWQYKIATVLAVAQFLFGTITVFVSWKKLPPTIPFWYSRPWGSDRLAQPGYLILPILSSLCIYILNNAISIRVKDDHPLFARILFLNSALVSFLSFICIVRVITLVV